MSAVLRIFSDFSQSTTEGAAIAYIIADQDIVISCDALKIPRPASTIAGELAAILMALSDFEDGERVMVLSDIDCIRKVVSGLSIAAGVVELMVQINEQRKRFKSVEFSFLPQHRRGIFYETCHWAAYTLAESKGNKLPKGFAAHTKAGRKNLFPKTGARTLLGPLLNEALGKK